MRIRRFAAIVVAGVMTLVLSVGVALPVGAASPQQWRAPSAVSILEKHTLPETSLGSPGFASRAGSTVLAWTGTDPAHHLNVETSATGLTGYGNKITLPDTSIAGPAVAQMSEAAGSAIILAWTGTDPSRRLNVLFDVYGQQKKVTYNQTSFTSPGLTIFEGNLLLAWAGTDANHSLNVAKISLSSLAILEKQTYTFDSYYGSNEGLTLATVEKEPGSNDPAGVVVEAALGWTSRVNHLRFAYSESSLNFVSQPALAETSPYAPVMMQYHTESGPEFWIAWTGGDPAHHLNVKPTSQSAFPGITGNTSVLPETAFGHPGVGFNNGLILVWTGTDSAHHLNVLEFTGF